jgi:hypothetical protein
MATIPFPSPTGKSNFQDQDVTAFPDNAIPVIKSDADVFGHPATIYVGTGGSVTFVPWALRNAGTTRVAVVPSGGFLPCRVAAVKSTGTDADDMLAVY